MRAEYPGCLPSLGKVLERLPHQGADIGSSGIGIVMEALLVSMGASSCAPMDLVRMARDPHDERRQLYTLDPSVIVRRTDAGLELDFGCCLVRVR